MERNIFTKIRDFSASGQQYETFVQKNTRLFWLFPMGADSTGLFLPRPNSTGLFLLRPNSTRLLLLQGLAGLGADSTGLFALRPNSMGLCAKSHVLSVLKGSGWLQGRQYTTFCLKARQYVALCKKSRTVCLETPQKQILAICSNI